MSKFLAWIDARFPWTETMKTHASEYYAPKNFNFWYYFGVLAMVVFIIQILSGIFLTMHYKPDASLNKAGIPVAFASVEYIMRDVPWGWLIRYIHSTGASFFFIVIYLHMFRALLYGSHHKPRELLWIIGMLLYLALMAEAFMGYLLPWGQMSFWGAQVIVNLFDAIPVIGPDLAVWIRGDYVIGDATLNRFFAFHVILLPLLLAGLVFVHIVALHHVGSNNPDGIEIKKKIDPKTGHAADGIPFHPYYTVKDSAGTVVFLALFAIVIFFMPTLGGYFLEHNNFVPADPLKTPEHIAPVWYFTPYYSILRAVPPILGSQFPGVALMILAVIAFVFLPWLDRSKVRSVRYRGPLYKWALGLFAANFIMLGYLGVQPVSDVYQWMARIGTVIYFAFFILMPWYTKIDQTKPEPERVTWNH